MWKTEKNDSDLSGATTVVVVIAERDAVVTVAFDWGESE